MKAREERYNVLIPARIRWGGQWTAASVRNISTRGLMLRTALPPSPGTYVEVQLGSNCITARSMWVSDQTCGLQSQDRIDVNALRGNRSAAPAEKRAAPVHTPRALSVDERAARNRRMSSIMQYVTFTFVATAAAGSLGWEVFHTLSAPINAIETKLV